MAAEYVMIPHWWRRYLAVVRILLSVACLAAYTVYPVGLHPLIPVLFGLYAVAAAVALRIKRAELVSYGTLALITDAAFFLVIASHPAPQVLWLSFVFYFYLLLLAALIYPWRQVLWLVGACVAFVVLGRPPQLAEFWPIIVMAGVMACTLAIQKRQFQERLSSAFRRAVLSRSEAEVARVIERQRIAADFHDGPLQSFISFQMRLEIVRRLLLRSPDAARQELEQLQEICRNQVSELRTFVRSMRPGELDSAGLNTTLRRLVKSFEEDSGIFVKLQSQEFQSPSDPESAMEVLQIIRETLHNVQKHARASRAAITLGNVDESLEIVVEDDGSGFPFSGAFTLEELDLLRLGPSSVKRRVRSLGGELTLESRPGRGATVRVRVPL